MALFLWLTRSDLMTILRSFADTAEREYKGTEKSGEQVAKEIALALRETAKGLPKL